MRCPYSNITVLQYACLAPADATTCQCMSCPKFEYNIATRLCNKCFYALITNNFLIKCEFIVVSVNLIITMIGKILF